MFPADALALARRVVQRPAGRGRPPRFRPPREQRHHLAPHRRRQATAWSGSATTSAAATPQWNRAGVKKVGDRFEIALQKGQTITATFAKPSEIP